jgi:hypothetical protein
MKSVKSNQLKKLREDLPKMMRAIREEAIKYPFLVGSYNSVKLKRSLILVNRLDLIDKNLLPPKVHKIHSSRLVERYIKKWKELLGETNLAKSLLLLSLP